MLEEVRLKQLNELINSSTKEDLIWINGYLSGLVASGQPEPKENGSNSSPELAGVAMHVSKKISIVFGTETGNSKKLAGQLAAAAKKNGFSIKLTSLEQYRSADLLKEEYLVVVISTHGEGIPPAGAVNFYDHLHQLQIDLPNLKYGVLGLGDSSYPLFCKTGEDVDTRLHHLGAKRIVPLQKCDVDYEEDARQWFDKILGALDEQGVRVPAIKPREEIKKATGKKYYTGTIIHSVNLNDRGSKKQTYHIEITTPELLDYEPGDALAVVPGNRADVVEKILAVTGIDPSLVIEHAKRSGTVRELLSRYLNICYLLSSTIKKYAAIIQQEIPDTRMDLIDLLRIYPVKDIAQFVEVIKVLSPIAPRLYSVSSSLAAHGNEVHITVARDRFLAQDEQRYGLCSEFLGDLPVNSTLDFYIHKNRAFKLPPPEKDLIMIGPGTGIAPFRSFLSERDATGAPGRNWLFFGEQHFTTDFLYQTEIQQFVATGSLQYVDLAFSRDQPEKIYVQHRMHGKGRELFNWIERGAFIYISGTKDPMSREVETTLLRIISEEGNKSMDEAKEYLDQLKKEDRYEKDVY
jgi:sulfite reductase (NADPH) flavoprotein alpha-component